MKKIFAIALTLCLMVSALCVMTFTASAEEPAENKVMRVSGLKNDGTTIVEIGTYDKHATGWEAAIDYARDRKYMITNDYNRIVVDLLADWNGDKGKFAGSGEGFYEGAIRIYDKSRITINMNGYTIDRGRSSYDYNGEVIFIANDADVIINGGTSGDPIIAPGEDADNVKMGTITGGFSCNGGGGIHMQKSNVTLNNVNLVGNSVEDDDGAAIAVHDGGMLTMNGGCLANNSLTSFNFESLAKCWGTLYTDDSTAMLNKVHIYGNTSSVAEQHGLAVALNGDSVVALNDCIIENNGEAKGTVYTSSIFFSKDKDSMLSLNNCEIKDNYTRYGVFYFRGTYHINGGKISGNNTGVSVIYVDNSTKTHATIENVTITDNAIPVLKFTELGYLTKGGDVSFINCTFNNNAPDGPHALCGSKYATVNITDCDLGDSTFVKKDRINFTDTSATDGAPTGSIFVEGSLAMIVAILSLVASTVSICLTLIYTKNRKVLISANNAAETEESATEENEENE